jgi:hypothetical protein
VATRLASDVPVPELIRRGYDRAKGLGHDGIDGVLDALRELAREMSGAPLPPANAGERVVLHPAVVAAAWSDRAADGARQAVSDALDGPGRLGVTHPLLMRQVAALQAAGCQVRPVVLWIAAMTVVPAWGAPGAAPQSDDADTTATVAAAVGLGAVAVVPAEKAEGTETFPVRLVST